MNNLSIYPTQTNTKRGPFRVLAGVDLTDMEGRRVKLSHDTGVPEVLLPTDVDDKADYLVLEGAADGEEVTVIEFADAGAFRIRLNGTCNPGDELTNIVGGGNSGKVQTLPVGADTYYVSVRAEEKGVDEQLVLVRPILNARSVVVP